MLATAKNHAKNMPCFEKIKKFQAKSYLNRQNSKKERKNKFFHTKNQNIQKILASIYF